jgi:hypothetical protein
LLAWHRQFETGIEASDSFLLQEHVASGFIVLG